MKCYIIVNEKGSVLHSDRRFYVGYMCVGSLHPLLYKRRVVAQKNANRYTNAKVVEYGCDTDN